MLLFAAWTSSINISEPLVSALTEKTFLNRLGASIVVAVLAFVIGLLSVFSFNIFGHFEFMGKFNLFTIITDLVTNIILPVGGVLFCIYAGWLFVSVCFSSSKKLIIFPVYNIKKSQNSFLDSESGLTLSANCALLAHHLLES